VCVCVGILCVLYGFLSHFYLLNIMMRSSPAFSKKKKEKKKPSQHTPLTVHTFSKSSSPMVEFLKKKNLDNNEYVVFKSQNFHIRASYFIC